MGRFNKEGEPGRKITCAECHQAKVGDEMKHAEPGDASAVDKTIKKKTRKLVPKVCQPIYAFVTAGFITDLSLLCAGSLPPKCCWTRVKA